MAAIATSRVAPAAISARRNAVISRFGVPVSPSFGVKLAPVQIRQSVVLKAQTPPGGKPSTDSSAPQVNPAVSAFTRRREAWVGRLAMFGWLAAYVGEILLHKGPIGQTSYILGWSNEAVIALLVGIVVFNGISAAAPGSPTWSKENQQDIKKRPSGPPQNPKLNPLTTPGEYVGLTQGPGFAKSNELFVGRSAMLGFFAAVVGEYLTGKGPIAQVAGFLGADATDNTYRIAGYGLLLSALLITALGYLNDNKGETASGDDIY